MTASLYDYCRAQGLQSLLGQWVFEKNAPLTPNTVSYGSKKRVWWKCEKGHEWQAAVYTRTGGSGCPYCAGKRVCRGENDLASQRPDLAAEWHPAKNRGKTPADVTVGSHYRAWWVCGKGHEWQAVVKSRVSGCGCPVCTNRTILPGVNDLAATHPGLAKQWHPTKNGSLTPYGVTAGTRRKVWWQCAKGHQWQASVMARACGRTDCPVCAGKAALPGENALATLFPAIAAEWNAEKNGALTPSSLTPCSNRKVWWKCGRGHEYQAVVAARTTRSSGCPYCAGKKVLPGFNDLATVQPKVAAQWHPVLNGSLTPAMVTAGSSRKVWWQCPRGHVWKAVVYSRAGSQKTDCPVCAGKVRPGRAKRYWRMLADSQDPALGPAAPR